MVGGLTFFSFYTFFTFNTMTFAQSITTCFRKYATFSGRATRSEFWWFWLFTAVISLILSYLDDVFWGLPDSVIAQNPMAVFGTMYLRVIWGVGTLLPSLAVAVRRLHDIGKSGWWYLINFILIVGTIVYIIFMCTGTQPFDNKYGAEPGTEDAEE